MGRHAAVSCAGKLAPTFVTFCCQSIKSPGAGDRYYTKFIGVEIVTKFLGVEIKTQQK